MVLSDGRKSILASCSVHILLCAMIGVAGLRSYAAQQKADRIYTVDIVSGEPASSGGGASSAQSGSNASPDSLPGFQAPVADTIAEDEQINENRPQNVPRSNTTTNTNFRQGQQPGPGRDGPGKGGDGEEGDGPKNQGPGFDTNAIQPDVSPSFLGGNAPVYPESMRNHGISGRVRVQMVVSKSGGVESAQVISSSGYGPLDQAALDAAYSYRFQPAQKAGYTVRCYATKTFTFGLR